MIYIVRHGQTQWNLQGKKQGWKDSPLTHKGIKQGFNISRLLEQTLRNPIKAHKVVISPPAAFRIDSGAAKSQSFGELFPGKLKQI